MAAIAAQHAGKKEEITPDEGRAWSDPAQEGGRHPSGGPCSLSAFKDASSRDIHCNTSWFAKFKKDILESEVTFVTAHDILGIRNKSVLWCENPNKQQRGFSFLIYCKEPVDNLSMC